MVGRKVTSVIASGTGSHTQGHTHTANPLSCATAAAVLRYIKDNDVVAHAASRGQYLGKRLRSVLHDKANVGVVRGKYGMFYGVRTERKRQVSYHEFFARDIVMHSRMFISIRAQRTGG
eukprot:SAG31_NODE_297_length_18175_cov_68.266659_4_plen_119_part_00